MIREMLQSRRVVSGLVAALIFATLAWFLLLNRDTSPSTDTAGDSQAKIAESTAVTTTRATPRPTLPATVSATPTATPEPSPSTTASATPTPRATGRSGTSGQPAGLSTPRPTRTATATPRPTKTPTLKPTQTSEDTSTASPLGCLDSLYLADVTIPDDTHLEKGESFVKTWRVKNNGSCDWPEDTQLVFVRGEPMGAPDSVPVGPLAAGESVEISVDMVAPDVDDHFEGVWNLAAGDGESFGTWLSVVIRVGEEPTPAPTATPDPNAPTPTSAPAPPPPPPPGGHIGGGFELGGHVAHFGNSDLMHYAGMKWVKVQMHHGADAAGVVAEAHAHGLKILVGAVGDASRAADPGYQDEFAGWLGSVAAAGADAIEVWNEPNIDREWAQGQIDPASYTEMLRRAYTAIKNANPGTMVVSAALSPTWHNPPYHWGDDVYLAGMVASGAANYVDCYGIHYNSGTVPPSQTSGASTGSHYSWYFWGMINTYWNASGGTRKLCFTELGYLSGEGYCQLPGNFAWAANTTVAHQAAWLAQAAVLASNSGKVRLMIIWNVNFTRYDCGPGNGDPQAGYGIIRPDGGCPACETLHAVTH